MADDRVLLITGASTGIGAAAARQAAAEGWRVVLGAALSIRAILPHFRETHAGHMVLTSSVAGRRALPGSLYSATKWAVTAMGEALRQELRNDEDAKRVRVTLIEPGMVDTPFFDSRVQDALHADDIARTVLFALSQPEHVDVNEILVRPTSQAS